MFQWTMRSAPEAYTPAAQVQRVRKDMDNELCWWVIAAVCESAFRLPALSVFRPLQLLLIAAARSPVVISMARAVLRGALDGEAPPQQVALRREW